MERRERPASPITGSSRSPSTSGRPTCATRSRRGRCRRSTSSSTRSTSAPASRVLDVGCGPGRHAHELARRGVLAHGVDISAAFVELARADAPAGATFERCDARHLAFDGEFDAVISLCQGGVRAVGRRRRGRSRRCGAWSGRCGRAGASRSPPSTAYFAVRTTTEADLRRRHAAIAHERTEVRDEQGAAREVDLWTACFTPRELRLLCGAVGARRRRDLLGRAGRLRGRPRPTTESPEFSRGLADPPI